MPRTLGQTEVLPIRSITCIHTNPTGLRTMVVTITAPGATLVLRLLHDKAAEARTLIFT
ncbi:hypothetical protein [Clavibacter michiganensis]|uniref:hypothetical protein n=1 Tax=Clavibacter michiganensis TaxID=28447 RepID=UPI000A567CEB|nr:hypothetical protein [Clavibacter michiganensis]